MSLSDQLNHIAAQQPLQLPVNLQFRFEDHLFDSYWVQAHRSISYTVHRSSANPIERIAVSYMKRHRFSSTQQERALLNHDSCHVLHTYLRGRDPGRFGRTKYPKQLRIPSQLDVCAAKLAEEYIDEHLFPSTIQVKSVQETQALILCSQLYPKTSCRESRYKNPEQLLIWSAQQTITPSIF